MVERGASARAQTYDTYNNNERLTVLQLVELAILKDTKKRLRLTNAQLAKALSAGTSTVARWQEPGTKVTQMQGEHRHRLYMIATLGTEHRKILVTAEHWVITRAGINWTRVHPFDGEREIRSETYPDRSKMTPFGTYLEEAYKAYQPPFRRGRPLTRAELAEGFKHRALVGFTLRHMLGSVAYALRCDLEQVKSKLCSTSVHLLRGSLLCNTNPWGGSDPLQPCIIAFSTLTSANRALLLNTPKEVIEIALQLWVADVAEWEKLTPFAPYIMRAKEASFQTEWVDCHTLTKAKLEEGIRAAKAEAKKEDLAQLETERERVRTEIATLNQELKNLYERIEQEKTGGWPPFVYRVARHGAQFALVQVGGEVKEGAARRVYGGQAYTLEEAKLAADPAALVQEALRLLGARYDRDLEGLATLLETTEAHGGEE